MISKRNEWPPLCLRNRIRQITFVVTRCLIARDREFFSRIFYSRGFADKSFKMIYYDILRVICVKIPSNNREMKERHMEMFAQRGSRRKHPSKLTSFRILSLSLIYFSFSPSLSFPSLPSLFVLLSFRFERNWWGFGERNFVRWTKPVIYRGATK